MALPKQVAQQLKEIEELEKQLAGNAEPPPEETLQEEPAPEPAEPVSEEKLAPNAETKPNETKTSEVPEETWQQKYRTLQGMYDAEVPRLHAKVKELETAITQLRTQQAEKPVERTEPSKKSLVTDADVETFGADLIEVQRKVAREVAAEFETRLEALAAENAKLRDELIQTDSRVGEVSFDQKLRYLIPDFDQINNDPKWIAWLDEFDPILRSARRTVAQDAYARGDADGVAYYVKLFRDTQAAPQIDTRQSEVERQIQPTRTATAQTPVSQKGKIYTTRDVEKMFQKVAELTRTSKFEEAKKLEAEIDAAYLTGRVTA
jgi:hypothetical protein